MDKRIDWVDTTKGIGIILMVVGHTTIPSYFSNWIYSFHMPLFFILSGMLFNPNKIESYGKYIKHKSSCCLIPYMFFLSCDILYRYIWDKNIPIGLFTNGEVDFAYWFLQVLYTCTILNCILILELKRWYVLLIIVLSLIGYFLYLEHIHLPYRLDVLGMASFYYGWGFLVKNYLKTVSLPYIIILSCFMGSILMSCFVPRLDMNYNYCGAYLPNIITALLGTFTMIIISKKIVILSPRFNGVLSWAGKNSMLIMGLSQPINMSVKFLLEYLHYPRYVSSLVQYILLISLLFATSVIINKYAPILIGKVKK